jgi:glutathione S-transferase
MSCSRVSIINPGRKTMLKLYAHPFSSTSRKVHWFLEELSIPYEYKMVDLSTGEHKSPAILNLYPSGIVPFIEEGGVVLGESNAILLHLSDRHGDSGLRGRDASERAKVLEWMFWEASSAQNVKSLWTMRVMPAVWGPVEAGTEERFSKKSMETLAQLDGHLSKNQYALGDHFTVADIALCETIGLGPQAGLSYGDFAQVRAWLERLAQRPAFEKTRPR